jgi:putative ABC transport system permease protein
MIFFNVKIALRNLWKNRVFSFINLTGLALSMACCLVISLYIWNECNFDSFHKRKGDIFRITERQNQAGSFFNVSVTPGPLAPALQKDFPEIEHTVRFGSWSGVLKNGSRTFENNNMLFTENSMFKIFDFVMLKGNRSTALKDPNEIVVTEKIAEQYFGKDWSTDPALLGKVFRLNNEMDFKLTGVVKAPPANSSIQFDVLLPIEQLFAADKWSNQWGSNNFHTYILTKPGVDVKGLASKLEKQLHVYNSKTEDLLQLQPLSEQYLYSKFDFSTDWGPRSDIKYIWIFSGVGLLLLLIACINFINLSTARSLKRSMEVGVRKVNGASRQQLVMQFLMESVLLSAMAGVISATLLIFAQPLIYSYTGYALTIDYSSSIFLAMFLVFILVIGVLAGLYPAFVLSSFKPIRVMKSGPSSRHDKYFRQGLVVFQFAISITLIISSYFIYKQLVFMRQKDLGFDKEQLIIVRLSGSLMEKSSLYKHDLSMHSSIVAIAPATISLVNVENSTYMEWDGMQADEKFLITQANVDPDFIPTLQMKLLSGVNFSKQVTNDTANFIVNESAVKRMGMTNEGVLGKQINFWGAKGTIIGVVKDFHFKSLASDIAPFIFRYQPQDRYFSLFVKAAPGRTTEAIRKIEQEYKKYELEYPLQYRFVSESINNIYKKDGYVANIIFFFSMLTVFVGCLGLLGLTVFAAEQRVKEIGIRKVLGAGIGNIVTLLLADFLKLVMLAAVIAVPGAWISSNRWLQQYVYRIPVEWGVFAAASLGVFAIAAITISAYAIKSARANPVISLRSE